MLEASARGRHRTGRTVISKAHSQQITDGYPLGTQTSNRMSAPRGCRRVTIADKIHRVAQDLAQKISRLIGDVRSMHKLVNAIPHEL